MQSGLRVGRIGPLTVRLHYIWMFASVLVLWWVALLWLPENFPAWANIFYWLVAIAVLILFILSMVVHELIHSIVARTGPHSVLLFPFGAAVPFRLQNTDPIRALIAALAAPIFDLIVGGVLILVGQAVPGPEHFLGWLKAILIPLGWLNLWVGLINLIPGTPFDGGMALAAGVYSVTGDREGGLGIAESIGRIATLVLVLAGAWRGLTSDMWLQALALVLAGWAAREAATIGQERRMLRTVLSQMKAGDFMEISRPNDVVRASSTVADLVRTHPHFPPNAPLPVLDDTGSLVGVTTIGATENLLQGTWPNTPVRSITTPIDETRTVSPGASLVDVLAVVQARPSDTNDTGASQPQALSDDEPNISVIDDGGFVGSIDPARLQSFEEAGRQFGVEEAIGSDSASGPRSRLSSLGSLLPVIIVLTAMAVLGNFALHTDPMDLQGPTVNPESSIVFSNFNPADGDIVGLGDQSISVQIESANAVTSATITLDGQTLETELSGSSSLTRTASTVAQGLTLGSHTARINAVTENGDRKSSQWRFRVDSRAGNEPGTGATPTVGPSPTNAAVGSLQVERYVPTLGGRVPAGSSGVIVSVEVKAAQAPQNAQIIVDGKRLDTKIEPVAGVEGVYRVSAGPQSMQVGLHTARAEIVGDGGEASSFGWAFSALQAGADQAYFKETGYFVTQPFLKYWQEKGGLGLFGYPISDLIQETDKATGEVYRAQYFERARFETHASTGDEVILGRLGALVQEPEPPAQPKSGAQFFSETGHNVSPPFLQYWNEHGGLAVFGYPITEERIEKNPIDGKEYTVQYFERNRFELHPENVDSSGSGTAFEVQLGLLGTQLYRKLYGPSN